MGTARTRLSQAGVFLCSGVWEVKYSIRKVFEDTALIRARVRVVLAQWSLGDRLSYLQAPRVGCDPRTGLPPLRLSLVLGIRTVTNTPSSGRPTNSQT